MPVHYILNRLGNGTILDGLNDFIQPPNLSGLAFQYNSIFTIACIVVPRYKSTSTPQAICSRSYDASNGSGWLLTIVNTTTTSAKVSFTLMRNKSTLKAIVTTTNEIPFNVPVSIIVIKSGSAITDYKIFINGVEAAVTSSSTLDTNNISYTSSQKHLIGAQSQGGPETSKDLFLKSPLHGLVYLSKAVTAEEIAHIVANDLKSIPSTAKTSLIAWYDFNKREGDVLEDRVAANNGVINNATTTIGAGNIWANKYQEPITA